MSDSKWPPRHDVSAGDLPQRGMLVLAYWRDSSWMYAAAKLNDSGAWTMYDGEWGEYVQISTPNYWWELPDWWEDGKA